MTFGLESLLVSSLAALAADARPEDRANFDVTTFAPSTGARPVTGGVPVARAPRRDVPSLMWVPRGQAPAATLSTDVAARQQLELHANSYGITREVIAGARTVHIHDTGRGGIIVLLRQTVGGVDLFHGDVKLLLDRSRRLLAISGAPHPNAHPGAAQPFTLGPEDAIAAALRDLHGEVGDVALVEVEARAEWRRFALAGDSRLRFLEPARARPVYVPLGEQLLPAHLVELQTRLGAREDVYQYIVAADDGRLLMRRDATHHATHQYRVYAESDGLRLPLDGPLSDFNPHPTGVPGPGPAGLSTAALVTIDGLNTNPDGMSDPWLPEGATESLGNNVDAYIDRLDTDPVEADRIRVPVSGPGVFDYTYDVAEPALAEDAQYMAALTHAFYVANWLHDWWYDSGFVEAVGAAQRDNYGRGGADGDRLLLQTQDAASLDLYDYSSIAVPLDGVSPRVRFYLWLGPESNPDLTRDSGLDSLLIAHEYGHLVDTRLADHGTAASRAMGEGWGDFMAQLMSARPGDDLDGVFVSAQWATADPTAYFGLRRFPYSTDEAYNALSFRHISDSAVLPEGPIQPLIGPNSEQHNAGEVWASMLWESYVALHRLHEADLEFDQVRRLMSDYVVAGLMLAPVDATYTETRDALLMAIAATSHDDMLAVAEAFAERGAGSCAVSPPRHSLDLEGVVEDFEVRGRGVILDATVDDSLASCDGDGLLDVGELGRITVEVFNGGVATLPAGATLEVVDPPAGLVFPDGPNVTAPELAALQQETMTIAVAVADDFVGPALTKLRLRLTTPGGCDAPGEATRFAPLEADAAPSGATFDDVEVATTWTLGGDDGDKVWSRQPGLDSHVWRGENRSFKTDGALESPPFTVAADKNLVISFDHAFSFDILSGTFWDGGVIELSDDDGATWQDLGEFVAQTTYVGVINAASNVLVDRQAFVGESPGYPALKPVSFDFGTQLAGKTMRLRFRIATNTINSAEGWSIDNLQFEGLSDAPFSQLVADASACDPVEPTTTGDPTTTTGDPTTTAGDSTSSGSSAGDDSDSAGSDPGGADPDAGCGCVSQAPGAGWLGHTLALALLALRRRRKAN